MNKSERDIVAELRETFPSLSDQELLAEAKSRMGLSKSVPTVSEVLDELRAVKMQVELARKRTVLPAGHKLTMKQTTTLRTYETTWRRFEAQHGSKLVTEVSYIDVSGIALEAKTSALAKLEARNAKRMAKGFTPISGNGTIGYNRCLSALAVFFEHAKEQHYITINPMHQVTYVRETAAKSRRLTPDEVDELLRVAISGGTDPELDHLFIWTLMETAGRVGGMLNLQLQDLQVKRQMVTLYEKGGVYREQPVTAELAQTLWNFATSRGATQPSDGVFRYSLESKHCGRAITSRRVDGLWKRLREELPWVEEKRVSSHALRHTTLSFVDLQNGRSVTRRFAGHKAKETTDIYAQADDSDVARALVNLFGRPHPEA